MASVSGSASPRYFGRLVTYRNGDMTLFIPNNQNNITAAEMSSSNRVSSEEGNADTRAVVLINTSNRTYTLFQSVTELNSYLSDLQIKVTGTPRASISSIESLPIVENREDDDCSICLNVMKQSKVMPCKHMFHGTCIEKWLRIHGSCPVCRFTMPVEEIKDGDYGLIWGRVSVVYVPVSVEMSSSSSNLSSNRETL